MMCVTMSFQHHRQPTRSTEMSETAMVQPRQAFLIVSLWSQNYTHVTGLWRLNSLSTMRKSHIQHIRAFVLRSQQTSVFVTSLAISRNATRHIKNNSVDRMLTWSLLPTWVESTVPLLYSIAPTENNTVCWVLGATYWTFLNQVKSTMQFNWFTMCSIGPTSQTIQKTSVIKQW
jgi:hypothetical protein